MLHIASVVYSVSDPVIDSRYLQRTDEIPLREAPRTGSPTQTSLHFSGPPPTVASSAHPTRLSKDAILSQRPPTSHYNGAPYTNSAPASKQMTVASQFNSLGIVGGVNSANKPSQPPLASAYFPTQSKVT